MIPLVKKVGPAIFCVALAFNSVAHDLGMASEDNYFHVKGVMLEQGDLSLSIDPEVGARISSLKRRGKELLYTQEHTKQLAKKGALKPGNNWGSTFWLSPQSLWGWPPITAHDSEPYKVLSFDQNKISLQSQLAEGARITKHISFSEKHTGQVDLSYEISAAKNFPEIAAWEITRVPHDGLVFYPVKKGSIDIAMGDVSYTIDNDHVLWLDLRSEKQPPEGKVNANGREGWLGWVVDRQLYLKIYEPVAESQMAAGEGDVEVYLSGSQPYVELEAQGAAHILNAGEKLQWNVRWVLQDLPEDINVDMGAKELLNFARQIVQKGG